MSENTNGTNRPVGGTLRSLGNDAPVGEVESAVPRSVVVDTPTAEVHVPSANVRPVRNRLSAKTRTFLAVGAASLATFVVVMTVFWDTSARVTVSLAYRAGVPYGDFERVRDALETEFGAEDVFDVTPANAVDTHLVVKARIADPDVMAIDDRFTHDDRHAGVTASWFGPRSGPTR